jgi:hypothetical protein
MVSRSFISLALALFLILVIAFPAFAGGWAVITLDELPTDVVAEEALTIGFVVRQHGITPMNGLYPIVKATLQKTENLVVQAEPDGEAGHYTATLTFPKAGDWNWTIQAFTMDQPMPALTVADSEITSVDEPVTKLETEPALMNSLSMLGVLVFGLALVGLVFAFQRKSRLAGGLVALCLVAGIGTFMLGAATPAVEARGQASSNQPVEGSSAQVEVGRQLFLAKGCITCHYNSRAADRNEYWTIEIGAPDLSNYSTHPDILAIRLKDPAAAKSDTKMPNLGLKETEIEALIAFINSK